HRFVPPNLEDHAYDDGPLPIGESQTISQPYMVALMGETSALTGSERVLEIGTGTGYAAAVLSHLAAQVYTVECIPHLHDRARLILHGLGVNNVSLRLGDGSFGWPEEAPYDVIVVSAAAPGIPATLLSQLKPEGRFIAPI